MAIEHEIKLALPPASAGAAHAALVALTGTPGQPFALSNIYFDTPEHQLASAKSALRLRLTPHGWLQTFKAGGSVRAGLHSRHEWEMPVAGAALERDTLLAACGDAPAADILRSAWPALQALFSTDFTRTLWHWHTADADIEIALDQGEASALVAGKRRSTPLHELELELKRGAPGALHALAGRLAAQIPALAPDNVSKAQRGYRLLLSGAGDSAA